MSATAASMTLRNMTATDLDLITDLDARLFGADCWPRHMFDEELSQPQTRRYLVAEITEHDGATVVVGYAGLMCLPPIGDIQTIGVLPAYEGRGYARAMMTELIAEAARRGAEDVMLEVSSVNPRAQELYRRFGFEHVHTRPRYYRDGSDGLIMRLHLDPHSTHHTLEEPS